MPTARVSTKICATSSAEAWLGPAETTSGFSGLLTLPRRSAETPILWIVAGPNGSGKSSVYQDADIEAFARSVWIINPDLLTARIHEIEGLPLAASNLQAVERIMAWLKASLRAHQTVGVETVLSTGKYRQLVSEAKSLRFQVRLTYVILDGPARNVERVRLRVAKGGHDVPEGKIRSRYSRSLEQLPWFLEQADQANIYDNSGATPRLIAVKKEGTITVDPEAMQAIVDAVASIKTN
jgi:predicted ABC-type ATPase